MEQLEGHLAIPLVGQFRVRCRSCLDAGDMWDSLCVQKGCISELLIRVILVVGEEHDTCQAIGAVRRGDTVQHRPVGFVRVVEEQGPHLRGCPLLLDRSGRTGLGGGGAVGGSGLAAAAGQREQQGHAK